MTAQEGGDTLPLLQTTSLPALDPADLATRYKGLIGAPRVEPAPAYTVGDVETFLVMDFAADAYDRVSARLVYATPGVYMWVQEGASFNEERVAKAAQTLDEEIFPAVRAVFGEEARPGVDGDEHIHIVHAFGLGRQAGYFDSADTLPAQVYELSNQREMLVVNLESALSFLGADSETAPKLLSMVSQLYYSTLARDFTRLVHFNRDPDEDAWLDMGFAALGATLAGGPDSGAVSEFWRAPGVQLTTRTAFQSEAHTGAAFLFTSYVAERFGDDLIRAWVAEPANGLASLDEALRARGGEVTALDVFADWVATNAINDPAFADGRYAYEDLALTPPRAPVDVIFDTFPVRVTGAAVNPFGTHYIVVTAPPGGGDLRLNFAFEGAATTPVLPLVPHSGRYVYWSNRGSGVDTTLTRVFDLSGVQSATLTFWAWHDIDPYRDYAYIAVSDDGGATWAALPATTTTFMNPNRLAVGEGFTGKSGGDNVVTYPYLGVAFGEGLTIAEAPPGSPAEQAGLRAGDVIAAIDGLRVSDAQGVTAVIDAREAGDVVTVSVTRDGAPLDIQVTLGENPTRFRLALPAWDEQTVDLSAYAGREVLVRFEYVSQRGGDFPGVAIDDIRVEEIGYLDDAETGAGGWRAEGWVRMDNTLPGRFLVQQAQGNAVTRLLGPDDAPAGAWTIALKEGEAALLAISGVTPFTTVPENYAYELTRTE